VAYSFGDGTMPKNLVAELDWPSKNVCFRIANSDHGENHSQSICEIPLSQLLMLREYLGDEVYLHLRESDGGDHSTGCMG